MNANAQVYYNFKSATLIYGQEKKLLWLRVTIDLKSKRKLQWESCSQDYFLHPEYEPKHFWEPEKYANDIALIKAQNPIGDNKFNSVSPIQLPDRMDSISPECEVGELAGYGENGNILTSTALQIASKSEVGEKVTVIIIKHYPTRFDFNFSAQS